MEIDQKPENSLGRNESNLDLAVFNDPHFESAIQTFQVLPNHFQYFVLRLIRILSFRTISIQATTHNPTESRSNDIATPFATAECMSHGKMKHGKRNMRTTVTVMKAKGPMIRKERRENG